MQKVKIKQIEEIGAKDVHITEDIIVTTEVGEIKFPSGQNYATISHTVGEGNDARNKTVKEVLDEVFTKIVEPTITQPSLSVTSQKNKYVPVGVAYDPTVTIDFRPGSYNFGPTPTGVTADDYEITLANGKSSGVTTKVATGSEQTTVNIAFDNAVTPVLGEPIVVSGTMDYLAGSYAKKNNGQDSTSRIEAGTATLAETTIAIPFLPVYYGCSSENATIDGITAAMVKALTRHASPIKTANSTKVNVSASSGSKQLIIAIPKGKYDGTNQGPTGFASVYKTDGLRTDISADFNDTPTELTIDGATYNIYVHHPAAMQPTNTYEINI